MKRTTTTLLVALAALLLAGSAQAQGYLRKANKQFELGAFAEAIPGFERALAKRPGDQPTRLRLARAYRLTDRLREAEQAFASALAAEADGDPAVAYGLAEVRVALGDYGGAIDPLQRAVAAKHPRAELLAARIEYAQANADAPTAWRVSNEFANSAQDDYAAVPVGEAVVFASTRGAESGRLYRSNRDQNGFLRVPQPLHRVLTEQAGDAPVAYAPSGELVAFTRNSFAAGERFSPESGWELSLQLAPVGEQLDFQAGKAFVHNGPGFSTGFPAFAPDGTRLYFASDRPGGEGGLDLYYSERTDSGWGEPVNLGPAVNTPGNELAPFATPTALYFASDALPGYGGLDVFRADLLGKVVTTVVNLGPAVNSPRDDFGFAVTDDGEYAYFTSDRAGGKGGLDVYRAVPNGKSLTIAVVDGKSGAPIPNAILDFSGCGQGSFLTGVDGAYTFRVLDAMQCRPTVRKVGYNQKDFTLDAKRVQAGQRLEVKLNPEDRMTIYEGKVIHSRTGDALTGVTITARQLNGRPHEDFATSDTRGNYELNLERQREYRISYEQPGMASIDREVSTYDSEGAGILSSFAMFPSPSASAPAMRPTAPTGAVSATTAPAENARRTTTSTRRVPGRVDEGFAVQVAAVAESTTDISDYQRRLAELGQVYGKREAGVLRVRVGPFGSRSAAQGILATVRAAGFADAFIAKESGGAAVGIDRVVTETVEIPAAAPASPAPSTTAPTAGTYLVRLATYGNFANFDAARASDLGTLTTRKRGEYTVVLLEGFASAREAADSVAAAKAAGFADAHVVVDAGDGMLRKVQP